MSTRPSYFQYHGVLALNEPVQAEPTLISIKPETEGISKIDYERMLTESGFVNDLVVVPRVPVVGVISSRNPSS